MAQCLSITSNPSACIHSAGELHMRHVSMHVIQPRYLDFHPARDRFIPTKWFRSTCARSPIGLLAERFSVAHWPPIPRWERCELAPRKDARNSGYVQINGTRAPFYRVWGDPNSGNYPLYPMLALRRIEKVRAKPLWYSLVFSWRVSSLAQTLKHPSIYTCLPCSVPRKHNWLAPAYLRSKSHQKSAP